MNLRKLSTTAVAAIASAGIFAMVPAAHAVPAEGTCSSGDACVYGDSAQRYLFAYPTNVLYYTQHYYYDTANSIWSPYILNDQVNHIYNKGYIQAGADRVEVWSDEHLGGSWLDTVERLHNNTRSVSIASSHHWI